MRSQTSVYQWPCPLPPLLFFALLFPAACAESTKCLMGLNLFSRPGRPGNVPQKEMNFHPAPCILIFYPKNTCICLQLHLLQTLSGTQIAGGCSDSADLGLGMMPLVPELSVWSTGLLHTAVGAGWSSFRSPAGVGATI